MFVLYRGGGCSSMPSGLTAKDIVRYEQEELGNTLRVYQEDLDVPSDRLAWVCLSEIDAEEYGDVEEVCVPWFSILASDDGGGYLVELGR